MRSIHSSLLALIAGSVLSVMAPSHAAAQVAPITYQGELSFQGQLADGSYEFYFLLFDTPTGINVIGNVGNWDAPIVIPVTNGRFTTQLNFSPMAFYSTAQYLQINVRRPGDTQWTNLPDRQRLTSSPSSLTTRGLRVSTTNEVSVGSGPVDSAYQFSIGSGAGRGQALSIASDSTTATLSALRNTGAGGRAHGLLSTANGYSTGGGCFVIRDLDANQDRLIFNSSGNFSMNRLPLAGHALALRSAVDASTVVAVEANAAGYAGFNFMRAGSFFWGQGLDPSGAYYIDRSAVGRAFTLASDMSGAGLFTSTLQNPAQFSRVLTITGRAAAIASGSAAVTYHNPVNGAIWSTGVASDGTFMFAHSGAGSPTVSVPILEITGGSDIAEPYTIASAAGTEPVPGMIVSIDPDRVGQMRVCTKAYDTSVAGIISGANGVGVGLTLTQRGSVADGTMPVANVGRVWCYVDADAGGAVRPGDLLTSSPTPGHAMKADIAKAGGAVVGKAMSSLESGRGFVLVLVGLK